MSSFPTHHTQEYEDSVCKSFNSSLVIDFVTDLNIGKKLVVSISIHVVSQFLGTSKVFADNDGKLIPYEDDSDLKTSDLDSKLCNPESQSTLGIRRTAVQSIIDPSSNFFDLEKFQYGIPTNWNNPICDNAKQEIM